MGANRWAIYSPIIWGVILGSGETGEKNFDFVVKIVDNYIIV